MSENGNLDEKPSSTWTYVPGRVIPLAPLNLEEIKRQLQDTSDDDDDDDDDDDNDNDEDTGNNILNESFRTENLSNIFGEAAADIEEKSLNSSAAIEVKENIPLVPSNVEKHNSSFDFDFSTLPVRTPMKTNSVKSVVSKINIPSSANKMVTLFKVPPHQPQFHTPKVTPITRPGVGNRLYLTPYSGTKNGTLTINMGSSKENDLSDKIIVKRREYTVLELLGKGGSSEVFSCFDVNNKKLVAVKVVNLTDDSTRDGYINEVKLLESLQNCDRIIKMHDYENQLDTLTIVLEHGGKDLNAILKRLATKQANIPIYMLLFYWLEMLYAVKQIHSNGVIHSDLKPANFLRVDEGLKLIDFGIASKVQENMTCVLKPNQEGSCNYISPEALNQQTYVNSPNSHKPAYKVHFKSDVWSLGCILYQFIYRRTPYQHITHVWAKLAAIADPTLPISYPKVNWAPQKIIETIKRCLQHDVKSRPSVDDLIEEYEEWQKHF
ncbi:hypothetical protein ABEB36_011630 [Hypothenemus hampei]|uniref:Protein kinase domain-containing protein n=1 Tax=Hypothenemus hampei TaxID=57062 RepID=A0ABD1ECT8_HYPHA